MFLENRHSDFSLSINIHIPIFHYYYKPTSLIQKVPKAIPVLIK